MNAMSYKNDGQKWGTGCCRRNGLEKRSYGV